MPTAWHASPLLACFTTGCRPKEPKDDHPARNHPRQEGANEQSYTSPAGHSCHDTTPLQSSQPWLKDTRTMAPRPSLQIMAQSEPHPVVRQGENPATAQALEPCLLACQDNEWLTEQSGPHRAAWRAASTTTAQSSEQCRDDYHCSKSSLCAIDQTSLNLLITLPRRDDVSCTAVLAVAAITHVVTRAATAAIAPMVQATTSPDALRGHNHQSSDTQCRLPCRHHSFKPNQPRSGASLIVGMSSGGRFLPRQKSRLPGKAASFTATGSSKMPPPLACDTRERPPAAAADRLRVFPLRSNSSLTLQIYLLSAPQLAALTVLDRTQTAIPLALPADPGGGSVRQIWEAEGRCGSEIRQQEAMKGNTAALTPVAQDDRVHQEDHADGCTNELLLQPWAAGPHNAARRQLPMAAVVPSGPEVPARPHATHRCGSLTHVDETAVLLVAAAASRTVVSQRNFAWRNSQEMRRNRIAHLTSLAAGAESQYGSQARLARKAATSAGCISSQQSERVFTRMSLLFASDK